MENTNLGPPTPPIPQEVDLRDYDYMPLDVARLRDSEMALLANGEEFKAAVLLWAAAWHQVPTGSLPNNDRILAHYSGAGERWGQVRDGALRGFILCSDGRLYHPLIAQKALEAWRAKQAQRARTRAATEASIRARMRRAKRNVERNVERNAERDVLKEEKVNRKKGRTVVPADSAPALPNWLPPDLWQNFREHRRRLRKPMTPEAERLNLRTLEKLRSEGQDIVAVVEQSIARGWQGLFPVRLDVTGSPLVNRAEALEARNRAAAEAWLRGEKREASTVYSYPCE